MNIGILGAGSWGTTLALLLARDKHEIMLWEFRPDAVEKLRIDRENLEFLPGQPFPDNLRVTADIEEAVSGAGACLIVVPSHAVRPTMKLLGNSLPSSCLVLCAAKGIEENSLMRMSQVVADTLGESFDPANFVTISGPSHAEEVVIGLPTSIVAASESIESATYVQNLMSSRMFRVYATDDLVGVELGGSLKNVIAIGTGISAGLGFGDNTMGAILTRGLAEMTRLGEQLGGRPSTFAGLSGMGDLITTCCSRHSRNRHVGEQIGKGHKLKEILAEMKMVAEGVRTTNSAWQLAKRELIEVPITEQVYRILFEDADPFEATVELMTRKLKKED